MGLLGDIVHNLPGVSLAEDIIGEISGADAAKEAADTQKKYLERAARTTREAADQARIEILDRMVPALTDYNNAIRASQEQIASGTTDVMQILQNATGNADQLLTSAGVDAQKAIMGSTAVSQGIPMPQFDQAYTQIQNAPPVQRTAMMQDLQRSVSRTPQTGGLSPGAIANLRGTMSPTQTGAGTTGVSGAAGDYTAGAGQVSRPVLMSDIAARYPGAVTGAGATPVSRAGSTVSGAVPSTRLTTQAVGNPPVGTPSATSPIGGTGTGFLGAAESIQQGYGTAQNALNLGYGTARGDVTDAISAALSQLSATRESGMGAYEPYSRAGRAAIEREAALSGAYGPEAQQEAINAYIESPGQAYLRQQQEKALLRNQAAIGGLGGANVRTALQEQAMNIASTQQQQYLENLRSLAARGQEVAGAEQGLISQTGMYGAQLTAGAGQTLAQLAQQYGISSAQLAQMSASELAQLANTTGLNLAQLQQATGAARAGLQTSLGSGLASATAGATSDIANLIAQGGTNTLNTQQGISSTLANLATGTGTNLANLQAQQGSALAAGQYAAGQALPNMLSDIAQIGMMAYTGGAWPGISAAENTENNANTGTNWTTLGIGNPSTYTP